MKIKGIGMVAALFAAILVYTLPAQALEVSARSAALLDGDSGEILWAKNAGEKSLIASTTKIMTALVVLEKADPEMVVQVPPEAVGVEGSSMYLKAGEELSIRELLYGMMLSSGNDAATALALAVSGSQTAFAQEMNCKAQELGLEDTHFANPHGLDSPENYSTAQSLGRLAAAAMQNPDFREIVSTRTHQGGGRSLTNHNKLLWQYPGAMGVKTGYTRQAGRILVGCAERDGRRLISVTIHDPQDWEDHQAMLDYGFSQYVPRTLVTRGQVVGRMPVMSGTEDYVNLIAGETVQFLMLEGEEPELRLWTGPFVYAPLAQGAALGTLQVYVQRRLVANLPVYAARAVAQRPAEPRRMARWLGRLAP